MALTEPAELGCGVVICEYEIVAIAAKAIVKTDLMVFIMLLGLLLMFQSTEYEIIPLTFYQRSDVVQISKELIGMYLFHDSPEGLTVGKIVETEAYNGRTDSACHAYHKRTKRTDVMYQNGGRAYVYLCYGIHHLFNIVTNKEGLADAVLIRALEPIEGIELMRNRNDKKMGAKKLMSGPGLVGKGMGFTTSDTNKKLDEKIWVARKINDDKPELVESKRVGVDYAGEDANLLWRFYEKGNEFISRK